MRSMTDPKSPHGGRDRAGRERGPAADPVPPPPAEDDLPADTVHEPAPASRWEGEGGAAVEPPPVPAPADETNYKDRWLRAEADLQNFRRRASREWEDARRNAEESVLLEMVALLDDL